jgi:hypothetical protein
MSHLNRRTLLQAAAGLIGAGWASARCPAADAPKRKFTINLSLGNIGVRATPQEAIRLARQYGFEALSPVAGPMLKYSDAPAGVPRDQLPDSPRKLPLTTGVIDLKPFLRGLVKIGYDGPVGTEPFDSSLGRMPTDEAMKVVSAAMKKAFALIEG